MGALFIHRWTHGKDTALDVTVVNPLQAVLQVRKYGSALARQTGQEEILSVLLVLSLIHLII